MRRYTAILLALSAVLAAQAPNYNLTGNSVSIAFSSTPTFSDPGTGTACLNPAPQPGNSWVSGQPVTMKFSIGSMRWWVCVPTSGQNGTWQPGVGGASMTYPTGSGLTVVNSGAWGTTLSPGAAGTFVRSTGPTNPWTVSAIQAVDVPGINGTTVPQSSVTDSFLGIVGSNQASWRPIPDCQAGSGNSLNYRASDHTFACGASGGGGGGGSAVYEVLKWSFGAVNNVTSTDVAQSNPPSRATVISGCFAHADVAPVGGSGITIDVKVSGISIFSPNPLINIPSGGNDALLVTTFNNAGIAPGAPPSANLTTVGTSTPGQKVTVVCYTAPIATGTAAGDLSGTWPNITVAKINGTTVPANPTYTSDTILMSTAAAASSWTPIGDCQDTPGTGNHLNYTAGTHSFTCGTSGSGGGGGPGLTNIVDTSNSTTNYADSGTGCATPTDRQTFTFSPIRQNTGPGTITFRYCNQTQLAIRDHDGGNVFPAGRMPATPATVLLTYHATGTNSPFWELSGIPRLATTAEATTSPGPNDYTAVTPAGVAAAINALSPCSSLGTLGQVCTNTTGAVVQAAEPPTNPASGRVWRWIKATGGTVFSADGTQAILTNVAGGAGTAVAPTSISNPVQLRLTAASAGTGAIVSGVASPIWAGSSPKLSAGVQYSATANISWFVGLVAESLKTSTSHLTSTAATGAMAGFRFKSDVDTQIMCVVAPNSSTAPVAVTTGLGPTTNPWNLTVFIDDSAGSNNVHFYNGTTEICVSNWGTTPGLPAGVALDWYSGVYALGAITVNQQVAYIAMSANQ